MTLDEIRKLVLSADASATRYEAGAVTGRNYTTWREVRLLGLTAEDRHAGGWAFQIDRFTQDEDDRIATLIMDALDNDPRVAYEYHTDYEPDTRYIHHIFDCEGF